ncbi:hypothetical protein Tco_0099311 [Tanacetum coccineum]
MKEKKSGKGKQKAKQLETISEAMMTEAEQLKIITKRSRKETHSSHASRSGADEGTGVSPEGFRSPDSDSDDVFYLKLKALEDNFSELRQTNQYAEALSSIPGIVDQYLANKMQEAVDIAVQLKYDKIQEESHTENQQFMIQIDKERRKSDIQKQLYQALVDAYEADKIKQNTYGDTVTIKRPRDDADDDQDPSAGTDRGSKTHKQSASQSAPVEETMQSIDVFKEPAHQEFETGVHDEQAEEEVHHLPDWFQHAKRLPSPDHAWNKSVPAVNESVQPWLSNLAKRKTPRLSAQLNVESSDSQLRQIRTLGNLTLMHIDELHKFSDGTLDDVRTALNDRLKGIRMEYLPQTFWSQRDKVNARAMIQAIDKRLKTRRIFQSLERFAEYDESNTYVLERFNTTAGNPVKKILLKLNLSDHRILKDGGGGIISKETKIKLEESLSYLHEMQKRKNKKFDYYGLWGELGFINKTKPHTPYTQTFFNFVVHNSGQLVLDETNNTMYVNGGTFNINIPRMKLADLKEYLLNILAQYKLEIYIDHIGVNFVIHKYIFPNASLAEMMNHVITDYSSENEGIIRQETQNNYNSDQMVEWAEQEHFEYEETKTSHAIAPISTMLSSIIETCLSYTHFFSPLTYYMAYGETEARQAIVLKLQREIQAEETLAHQLLCNLTRYTEEMNIRSLQITRLQTLPTTSRNTYGLHALLMTLEADIHTTNIILRTRQQLLRSISAKQHFVNNYMAI